MDASGPGQPDLWGIEKLNKSRGLYIPRGYKGHTGRQPRRQERTGLELSQNPTQGAAWEMEKTGRSADKTAWNQVFRQEEAYLAYGKTEYRMIKWTMEKEV